MEKIRGSYYFFEDRWYLLLDKIDKHLPIYKVVDRVDGVIPSFILLLLLVLLLLVLTGYLLNFTNTYDVSITVFDSETEEPIPSVKLFGSVNNSEFDELSDEEGVAEFSAEGAPMNFFGVFSSLLFPSSEKFELSVSAEKEGYAKLEDEELNLSTEQTEAEVYLSPIEDDGGDYAGTISIILKDADTAEKIIDSSSYIKFRCENDSSVSSKIVRDNDDGSQDGTFSLNGDNCRFLVTEIGAEGYETITNSFVLTSDREISLNPLGESTKGKAKIHVAEKGSSPELALSNISVKLNKHSGDSMETVASGSTDNSGNTLLEKLSPGDYMISAISIDENSPYVPITPADNITITVEAGETTHKTIYLEFLDPSAMRKIFVKTVDTNSGNVVSGARLSLYWTRQGDTGLVADSEAGNPVSTDLNGLAEVTGFASSNEGQLAGVIRKPGFVYKIFEPEFFRSSEGPQTVELERADTSAGGNAGSAEINVYESESEKPLREAGTAIYSSFSAMNVERILLDTGITGIQGSSMFTGLPRGDYFAGATYNDASSGISGPKALDVNQLVVFDLNIDTEISFLEVYVRDKDTEELVSEEGTEATVNIYEMEDPPEYVKEFVEALSQEGEKFTSSNYAQEERLMIEAEADGYIPARIITQNDLSSGANKYTLYLKNASALDGNVDITFDGLNSIFTENDFGSIVEERSTSFTMWNEDSVYYALFDVYLTNPSLSYEELFSMARIDENFVDIQNVSLFQPRHLHEESDVFSKITSEGDSPNPDSYYLPAGAPFTEEGQPGKQTGTKWAKEEGIPHGAYMLGIKFRIQNFSEDDELNIFYRAKEKHANSESETELKEFSAFMGESNCDSVCFEVTLNGNPVSFEQFGDTSNIWENVEEKTVFVDEQNPFEVKIYNGTGQDLSGTLRALSLRDSPSEDPSASGSLYFDPSQSNLTKTLASVNLDNREASNDHNAAIYPSEEYASDYLVLEYEISENSPSENYYAFVETNAPGTTMKLANAEFIAGLEDQNFDALAVPFRGPKNPELTRVSIDVYRNCDDEEKKEPAKADDDSELLGLTPTIHNNYFIQYIPGVYNLGKDCLYVNAEAKAPFEKIKDEEIYASLGDTLDPSLACVDIEGEEQEEDIYLEWGEIEEITISNTCGEEVEFYVESGLVCPDDDCGAKFSIDGGESKTVRVKAQNTGYTQSEKFSDILGVFPVYVKAKKESASPYKEFAVADRLDIHISNPDECFVIDKDTFDFVGDSDGEEEFTINDECQYTEFGDYYVPAATLKSFGANLVNPHEIDYDSVDFEWELVSTGGAYEVVSDTREVETYFGMDTKDLNEMATGESGTQQYNVNFDLTDIDAEIDKIFFKWLELIERNEADTTEYGLEIDEITVNYAGGGSETFTGNELETNFDRNAQVSCICDGERAIETIGGPSCVANSGTICEVGFDESPVFEDYLDTNFMHGITYIPISKGEVDSIDFSLTGSSDPLGGELSVAITPRGTYTETTYTTQPSGETIESFSMGGFTIYPFEGVTHILRNVSYGKTALGSTLAEKYCVENEMGRAWYDEGSEMLYWIEQYYADKDTAENICRGGEVEGYANKMGLENADLPSFQEVPESIRSNMSDFMQSSDPVPTGLWGQGENDNVLLSSGEISTESETSKINHYFPACAYQTDEVDEDYCTDEIINVVCDNEGTQEQECYVEETSESNIFYNAGYLGARNPHVRIGIKDGTVNAGDESTLQNDAVVIWIEGNYLKARFLGEDIEAYNDGSIELVLEDDFLRGVQYGIINIEDYVNRGRAKNAS